MGNKSNGIVKFLQNKNTVTVIGVVVAVLVLYVGYNMRVKSAVNPITVPYAKETIKGGTQITEDKVGTIQVPPSMLKGNVLTQQSQIIDKYARPDSIIPEGSLFYSTAVVEEGQLPNSIIMKYPKGQVLYNMSVTTQSTYGNSIYPENYIDIWLKIVNKVDTTNPNVQTADADKIRFGKLVENVKVLAVKDASGQPVFANLDEQRTPAMIIFAVDQEIYTVLKKAEFLRNYDATLIPVPTGEALEDKPGTTKVSSEALVNFINEVTLAD